jgi:hypothetical protein
MTISFQSDSRVDIELPNGKSILILYSEKQDEVSFHFIKGKRYLKEMQNRSDGHSSASFSKSEIQ